MKDDIKKAFYDYASLITSKISSALFLMISAILVTRLLGAAELGRLSLFLLVGKLFIILFITWTSGAILRIGKEEFIKKEKLNLVF